VSGREGVGKEEQQLNELQMTQGDIKHFVIGSLTEKTRADQQRRREKEGDYET
jgi:hypothetical protein